MRRTPTHPLRQGRFLLASFAVVAFGVVLLATEGDRRASRGQSAAAAAAASSSAVADAVGSQSAHYSSTIARRLLGGDAAPAASPPPPPPPLTAREALRQSLANYLLEQFAPSAPSGLAALSTWWTAAQSAIRDARGDGDGGGDGVGVALGGLDAPPFVLESKSAAFTAKLLDAAAALEPSLDATRDVIPTSAQTALCDGDFLRGVDGGGYDSTEVDAAYAAAWNATASPGGLHRDGAIPAGCLVGCVVGDGVLETIARAYGFTRTFRTSSWAGKCFEDAPAAQPEGDSNVPDFSSTWQPGNAVTNRIRVDYGFFINRLFGLTEPLNLFPGKAYEGASIFAPNETSIVVDYADHDHEFASFRDEIREIYPGTYLGKMYALPGTSVLGGVLTVPEGEPVFAINFILFGAPGMRVVELVGENAAPA